jgi:2-isopropylmalate synthase
VNKAIVGRNAFSHEAGIHQDGVLKDRRTYEILRAEDVGAPWNPLVLGKHSGRHAVQKRCADLGFQIEGDELVRVYRALMAIADERKILTEEDIHTVVGVARRPEASGETVDPFDTPATPPQTVMQESGYGHGV